MPGLPMHPDAVVTPRRGRCATRSPRERCAEQLAGETPSSSSSMLAPSLSAVSPIAGAGVSAGGGHERRLRLRCKTPAAAISRSSSVDSAGSADWDMWTGPSAARIPSRAKYFNFRRRFARWVADEAQSLDAADRCSEPGSLIVEAVTGWRGMRRQLKSCLIHKFIEAVDAPGQVKDWAAVTWPAQGPHATKSAGFVWAKSILLTYQGDWGVLHGIFLPASTEWREVVRRVAVEPAAVAAWNEFLSLVHVVAGDLFVSNWACSLEVCMQTFSAGQGVRFHLHLYLRRDSRMWLATADRLLFRGDKPHRSQNIGTLSQRQVSGFAGMYYLVSPKIGKVWSASSVPPFSGFPVSPEWVFTMLSAQKMEISDARVEIIAIGKGICRRLADLDRLEQARKEAAVEERVASLQAALAQAAFEFRRLPQVDDWFRAAQRPLQRRKRFLVLDGPSGLGKTEFVKGLVEPAATLELNCASCGLCPDLRRHDPQRHKVILFDEASPQMVLANRKLFQAPACWVDLGHSPTGRDVYRVFLNDSVLVVASNSWLATCWELPLESDREWLRANAVVVTVSEPLWVAGAALHA